MYFCWTLVTEEHFFARMTPFMLLESKLVARTLAAKLTMISEFSVMDRFYMLNHFILGFEKLVASLAEMRGLTVNSLHMFMKASLTPKHFPTFNTWYFHIAMLVVHVGLK